MKASERIVYYNMDGSINRFATYINNNEWVMSLVFITCVVITGFIESLAI